MSSKLHLEDIGEFGILQNYLIPALGDIGKELGDDCAIFNVTDELALVLTSDKGAKPLAWSIRGMSVDFADAGWLAVVASASDLATAGAKPFAITNNIEAPAAMSVEDLSRYVAGVADACRAFGFRHAGGDLAKSEKFASHCTAIGLLHCAYRVGRHRGQPGEYVIAVGPMGRFVSSYLQAIRKGSESLTLEQRRSLLRPTPQLELMHRLVSRELISAASDSSDGVIGALMNISNASGFGIELNLDSVQFPTKVAEEASASNLSPWNLLFFWGDWQIIATTGHLKEVLALVGHDAITVLGRVSDGCAGITARVGSELRNVADVRNENFKQTGFEYNLEGHIRFMLETPLF
jgi:thiamine-monophosphate kinase